MSTPKLEPGTPLPWKAGPEQYSRRRSEGSRARPITSAKGTVANTFNEQDAAYIVEACNAYPRQQEKIEALVKAASEFNEAYGWWKRSLMVEPEQTENYADKLIEKRNALEQALSLYGAK